MTWIKICGITNLEDAQIAFQAGVDALGFVFYERSPRKIDVETTREIVKKLPASVEKVGVFVDPDAAQIGEIVREARLTAIQLHGRFPKDLSGDRRSGLEWVGGTKVIGVIPGDTLKDDIFISETAHRELFAILVDSRGNRGAGGTGAVFDWEATRGMVQMISLSVPVIVAGGLTQWNVAEAIKLFQPFGVDVASGVEARPGKKDPAKVRAFVSAVRAAGKVT